MTEINNEVPTKYIALISITLFCGTFGTHEKRRDKKVSRMVPISYQIPEETGNQLEPALGQI